MNTEKKEYYTTGILLKLFCAALVFMGFLDRSIPLIAVAFGYWIASKNPWRYRIMINVGITLHTLLFFNGIYHLILTKDFISYLNYIDLFFNPVAIAFLLRYYPSPYPVLMNVMNFVLPAKANINFIDRYPALFEWFSRNSIVGNVEGLYYNSDAFNIIQEEGFLGFSPVKDIIHAATKAGVEDEKKLLDLGSGLGGPLCTIASAFKIHGIGLDILGRNVKRANILAASRNISDRVRFLQGDAVKLPFKDKTFDFVFGADAWCHVRDRKNLLKECHRVLKDGGIVFFYDWLDLGDLSEGFRFIYSFPPLETLLSYRKKLCEAGFSILYAEQNNATFSDNVHKVVDSVHRNKHKIIEVCGRELYDNWNVVAQYTLEMIDRGKLGHAFFIAKK
jgi:ubiquinone/menaquinone biosynthesis C-methylase UbiE